MPPHGCVYLPLNFSSVPLVFTESQTERDNQDLHLMNIGTQPHNALKVSQLGYPPEKFP